MSSERYGIDNSRSTVDFGQCMGYKSSKKHHFGPAGARSGAWGDHDSHNMWTISADD